jgi:hypothetical protein
MWQFSQLQLRLVQVLQLVRHRFTVLTVGWSLLMFILLLSLHHVDMGNVANMSEVHSVSIFRSKWIIGWVSVHVYIGFVQQAHGIVMVDKEMLSKQSILRLPKRTKIQWWLGFPHDHPAKHLQSVHSDKISLSNVTGLNWAPATPTPWVCWTWAYICM